MKVRFDFWVFVTTLLLLLLGLVMIYNSSIVIAQRDFADPYHYIKDQISWAVIGIIVMFIFSSINYHFWQKVAFPLLLGNIFLLFLVFMPGIGIKVLGAARWLNFGFFVVQPAEMTKISLTIYLAAWFSTKERKRLFAFTLLLAFIIGLIMLEPDMGTSIIIGSVAIILYFLSGAPIYQFFLLIPVVLGGGFILIKAAPYRLARLLTFLHPDQDPLGTSYHFRQTLFALGNGGLFGVGLGKSLQKYAYLPESTTDSIFAIMAEEIGFVGSALVICAFFFLIMRGFMIAKLAPDTFGKLLAAGLTSYIAMQVIINLSAQVGLLPFTGVPLPFISYGGSSLVISLAAVGILLNISKKKI